MERNQQCQAATPLSGQGHLGNHELCVLASAVAVAAAPTEEAKGCCLGTSLRCWPLLKIWSLEVMEISGLQPSWKEVGPRGHAWKRVLEVGSSHLWLPGCLKVSFLLYCVLP